MRFGFDKVVEADKVCWGKGVKVGKRRGGEGRTAICANANSSCAGSFIQWILGTRSWGQCLEVLISYPLIISSPSGSYTGGNKKQQGKPYI